ncbi:MAG: hypothetical protein R3227_02230 [Reinekea sp.]|nr:hypothetical protein [Reinekea sp.]
MAEQQYDLLFSGQCLEGHYVDFVKADLQTLFKASQDYIDGLFSGQEQIIKRKVDKATAIKFQQAFKKAGAKLTVKIHNPSAQPTTPIVKAAAAPDTKSVPNRPVQPQAPTGIPAQLGTTTAVAPGENADDLIEHHQPDIKAPATVPSWDVSAPGAVLGGETPFVPANIDTSDLSVAAPGADLIIHSGFEEPTPVINTDAISLADPGATIDTLDDHQAPVRVDISHLSLE